MFLLFRSYIYLWESFAFTLSYILNVSVCGNHVHQPWQQCSSLFLLQVFLSSWQTRMVLLRVVFWVLCLFLFRLCVDLSAVYFFFSFSLQDVIVTAFHPAVTESCCPAVITIFSQIYVGVSPCWIRCFNLQWLRKDANVFRLFWYLIWFWVHNFSCTNTCYF